VIEYAFGKGSETCKYSRRCGREHVLTSFALQTSTHDHSYRHTRAQGEPDDGCKQMLADHRNEERQR
jgi:hypothetical protein